MRAFAFGVFVSSLAASLVLPPVVSAQVTGQQVTVSLNNSSFVLGQPMALSDFFNITYGPVTDSASYYYGVGLWTTANSGIIIEGGSFQEVSDGRTTWLTHGYTISGHSYSYGDGAQPPSWTGGSITLTQPTAYLDLVALGQQQWFHDENGNPYGWQYLPLSVRGLQLSVQQQTVYLDFGGGNTPAPLPGVNPENYNRPASTITTAADRNTIATMIDNIYRNFLVNVVTTRPTSGEYTTLYFGGTPVIPGAIVALNATTAGYANHIDFGNVDRSDWAWIFEQASATLADIAQTAAHELGHLLGVMHVEGEPELLYPFADDSRTAISNQFMQGARTNGPNAIQTLPYHQNPYALVGCAVGLASGADSALSCPSILAGGTVDAGALASTLYNAQLGVMHPDGDAGPNLFNLGNLNGLSQVQLGSALFDGAQVFLWGSSAPGGPVDVFSLLSAPEGSTLLLTELGGPWTSGGVLDLQLFRSGNEGGWTPFGSVRVTAAAVTNGVPEPSTWALMLLGFGGMGMAMRRRSAKKDCLTSRKAARRRGRARMMAN